MPWVRIDDGYADHPKLAAVGPLGQALWFAGLAYCNRNLTDGFIPWSVAHRLVSWEYLDHDELKAIYVGTDTMVSEEGAVTSPYVITLLLHAGVWKKVKNGFLVHDYGDYQPTKAQVTAERAQKQAAGRAGGQASAQARAQAEFNPVPNPVPVPVSVPSSSKGLPSTQEPKRARVNGMTHVGAVLPTLKEQPTAETARLTKAQLDAWADFGPEWDAFKRAWFRKGLHFPPQGTPHDDDETNPSPRAMLYGILDSRPTDLPKWVAEAPGRTQREVINYILDQWHAIRDGAPSR